MNDIVHRAAESGPAGTQWGDGGGGVFQSTQWSAVMRAGGNSTVEGAAALERLCRQYWQPLYCFVRRRGYGEHDAQDLTQGFFERLLEKGLIGAADRERGRFRTFLLAALENYLANEWTKANRQKRGGGQTLVSLEHVAGAEATYQGLPREELSPDQLFERRWVQSVIEVVLRRLREELDARGGPGRFDVLKQFLFGDRGEVSYAAVAEGLGMSEPAVKSAIYRLRQRYGEIFVEEIRNTVADPADVDGEIRHLLSVLDGR